MSQKFDCAIIVQLLCNYCAIIVQFGKTIHKYGSSQHCAVNSVLK